MRADSITIGYLYYRFYPVTGGATIHGYYLARELNRLGYTLLKINGEPDPYSVKYPQSIRGALKLFRESDIIYLRADYFIKLRNILGAAALLSGKKVIVELNAPSDELHLFGKSERYIRAVDKIASWLLKRADAVITVSEPIKSYCEEALQLRNVELVENGGEEFSEIIIPSMPVKDKMGYILRKYTRRAVWAGSLNQMQDLETLREIAAALPDELAVILITDEKELPQFLEEIPSNIFIFHQLARKDVEYIIKQCQAGFAFYRSYPWSRWGVYNSSLKLFEYLNNGLLAFTNIEGTTTQKKYPNFKKVASAEEIIEIMRRDESWEVRAVDKRRWEDVANETDKIIHSVNRET